MTYAICNRPAFAAVDPSNGRATVPTKLRSTAIVVLALASGLSFQSTAAMAVPILSSSPAELEASCDEGGGQFVEMGDGGYGCIYDAGTTSCSASQVCEWEASSVSPDAPATKGGLAPKLQGVPLSVK